MESGNVAFISQGIASLQEALGAGIGNGKYFGILGLQRALGAGSGIGNFGILGLQGALGAGSGIGNFGILRRGQDKILRLGLQFPVSEFEPQIPDSTTFVGNWEFQRHGILRGLGLQFRNSRISIPSPPLHSHLTVEPVE